MGLEGRWNKNIKKTNPMNTHHSTFVALIVIRFGSNKDDLNESVQQPLRILRIVNDIAGTDLRTRNFMESSNTINMAVF